MEIFASIMYYFRQVAKIFGKGNIQNTLAGNLDPFYMASPLYFYKNYKDKSKMKKIGLLSIAIIALAAIQYIINDNIDILKMIVNIVKIIMCITCMLYTIENYKKIDILKIAKVASVFFAISIPISYIFYNSTTLWRHNDIHNKYTLSRLNLFYLEPSELGFHIAILIIILIGYLFIAKSRKEKITLVTLIILDSVVLYMARPMGAIVILTVTIGSMLLLDCIYRPSKQKIKLYSIIFIIFIIISSILVIIKSPIYMRIVDTLTGNDSSNQYRIGVTLDVFKQSFLDYKGLGCGFGNLNTENFISKYRDLGLVVVITNSFFYFTIESGIIGIISIIAFIAYMLKKCISDKSIIKWGILIFVVLYQVFAGHFTSAIYWILYGVILSGYNENIINRFY